MNGMNPMKSIFRHGAALLLLGLGAGLPGTAQSQTQTQTSPPPPPLPFSLAPTQPGDLFSLTSIGQPAGQYLKDLGIYLNLAWQNEVQANVMDGRKRGADFTAEPSGGVDLDLQQILGIPNASFHVIFDQRIGRPIQQQAATQNPLQDSFGPSQSFRLSELSYDQSLFDDHLRVLVGRINPTAEYLVSDFSCLFITSTCAQPQSWYFNSAENPYPTSTWGLRLTIKPTAPTYIRFGAYEEDPSLFNNGNVGFTWNTAHAEGVFIPAEIGYETTPSTARYPSHYAFGGYTDTSSYTEPSGTFGGTGTTRNGDRSAIWGLLEQTVWRPDPSTSKSLELFTEIYLTTGGYEQYTHSFVVGGVLRGPFPSRPNDRIGFMAYNFTLNGRTVDNLNSEIVSQGNHGTINPAQFTLQVNYGFRIAPGIFVMPDLEYNINPDQLNNSRPDPRIKDALIVGFQFTINVVDALGMPLWIRAR